MKPSDDLIHAPGRDPHTGEPFDLWLVFCEYQCGCELLHGRDTRDEALKLRKACRKKRCAACVFNGTN